MMINAFKTLMTKYAHSQQYMSNMFNHMNDHQYINQQPKIIKYINYVNDGKTRIMYDAAYKFTAVIIK